MLVLVSRTSLPCIVQTIHSFYHAHSRTCNLQGHVIQALWASKLQTFPAQLTLEQQNGALQQALAAAIWQVSMMCQVKVEHVSKLRRTMCLSQDDERCV